MADLLLTDARLFDPRSGRRWRGEVEIRDGRITGLPLPGEGDRRLPEYDCRGAFVTPGLHDAHLHFFMGGESLRMVRAGEFADKTALLQELAARARSISSGPDRREGWILGLGLDPAQCPSLAELDEATGDTPLRIDTRDLHSSLVNSAGLKLAGITAEREAPEGGAFDRDTKGELNGFLRENAALLMRPVIPEANSSYMRECILAAQEYAHRLGICAVTENAADNLLPVYHQMVAADELRTRVHAWRNNGNLAERSLEGHPFHGPWLSCDTVKLFADGSLGSESAAMLLAYLDGTRSGLVAPRERIEEYVRRALQAGWRIAVHAIGDAAVRTMLDLLEACDTDGLPVRGMRHRIEHSQFVADEDFERFARLELIASVQPLHAATDQDYMASIIGEEIRARGYPWRSLAKHALALPIGTDWPVEPLDPRQNLFFGSTRLGRKGASLLGSAEALDVDRLLCGLTWDAAVAARREEEMGCLAPGYLGDLTLFAQDPAPLAPEDLLKLSIQAVVVDGELQSTGDCEK